MSRYWSIDCSSSPKVTKGSLFLRRWRSRFESFPISIRAVSGFVRMSDEIEFSVLNRKCGLIWLDRALMRAAMSSFSCSTSWCSIRALFQILIGMAIASTVATITSAIVHGPVHGR